MKTPFENQRERSRSKPMQINQSTYGKREKKNARNKRSIVREIDQLDTLCSLGASCHHQATPRENPEKISRTHDLHGRWPLITSPGTPACMAACVRPCK